MGRPSHALILPLRLTMTADTLTSWSRHMKRATSHDTFLESLLDRNRHLGMIAGGTGITPMLQIIRAVLKDHDDKTQVSLIYANVTFDDILLKEELDHLAEAHPDRFSVYYVLNEQPADGWDGGVGFVTKDMIKHHMPAPKEDIKVLLCGKKNINSPFGLWLTVVVQDRLP
ncbi:NADH-cytochrome b5 reductase [Serendipita sp. 398]|nr:NADH-cytochrome b5 reductase [Serendipita sp. 398]